MRKVRRADGAELTGVGEVATYKLNVWVHVFDAGHPALKCIRRILAGHR